jgi:hypothetical protein
MLVQCEQLKSLLNLSSASARTNPLRYRTPASREKLRRSQSAEVWIPWRWLLWSSRSFAPLSTAAYVGSTPQLRHINLHEFVYKALSRCLLLTTAIFSITITMSSSKSLQPLRSVSRSLGALPAACTGAQVASRRYAGTIANFKIPTVNNEPNVRHVMPVLLMRV